MHKGTHTYIICLTIVLKISHKEYSFFTVHVNIKCSISNNSLYYSVFFFLKKKGTYCSGDKICTEQHGVHHSVQLHILFTTVKCLLWTCILSRYGKYCFYHTIQFWVKVRIHMSKSLSQHLINAVLLLVIMWCLQYNMPLIIILRSVTTAEAWYNNLCMITYPH
jgi:hypothetical protein